MEWRISRRTLTLDRPLVMAILNVTPDSFSDGGRYDTVDAALRRAEEMIAEGADIIDIGGQSTRPGSLLIGEDVERLRTTEIVDAIARRFETPVSIDTFRISVAEAALEAGAEIVNDISGLRWGPDLAQIAARYQAGLVLMHSRGSFETMHSEPPVEDILGELKRTLSASILTANRAGVADDQIVLDIGLGFGKTPEQNLELIAKVGNIIDEFRAYPLLVGASRKSFIGRVAGEQDASKRLGGSLAAALTAVMGGARIVRVHDVRETSAALKVLRAIEENK